MKITDMKAQISRANGGAWVKDLPFAGMQGVALKVRAAGSTVALEATKRILDQTKADGREPDPAEVNDAVIAEALALDWNLTDAAEQPIPCTPDNVRGILADPDIGPVARQAFAYAAFAVAEHGRETLEADAKN